MNKIESNCKSSNYTRVGGLTNLGNTCFFNAVLQCLAQTPYLVKVLEDLRQPGEKFFLPGGKFKTCDNDNEESEEIFPPIRGTLQGWGNFTSRLWETLTAMQNPKTTPTFNPSELRNEFRKSSLQCMDGGQHDSQELLRHLLELVRNEDLRRYQSVILQEIGLDDKTKRQNLDSNSKAKVKFYGNQASARLLGADPVFRGVLVSTIECLECHHTSTRTEPFLDLSLPVMVDKPQPPAFKRKNNGFKDNIGIINNISPKAPPPSKHQLKKERKAAKKNKKHQKRNNKLLNNDFNSLPSVNSISEENQDNTAHSEPEDDSDVDVEDNVEALETSLNSEGEKDDNLEKNDSNEIELETPLIEVDQIENCTSKTSIHEVETDECQSSPETDNIISENNVVSNDLDKLIETDLMTNLTVSNPKTPTENLHRYITEEGECSIQSCLNQFTALEIMSNSNEVGCEACTAREAKKNGNKPTKMVCTTSTKQFLISKVPAVLILHLKRFQSMRFRGFRKVSEPVKFPLLLDLEPMCKNHKKPKVYSLYGLVEHSGTLYGGHYVAYIKARQPLESTDPRWAFLPKKGANEDEEKCCDESDDDDADIDDIADEKTPEVPPGQWYYVSDTSVMKVDEASVLRREAYLLFYERIR